MLQSAFLVFSKALEVEVRKHRNAKRIPCMEYLKYCLSICFIGEISRYSNFANVLALAVQLFSRAKS